MVERDNAGDSRETESLRALVKGRQGCLPHVCRQAPRSRQQLRPTRPNVGRASLPASKCSTLPSVKHASPCRRGETRAIPMTRAWKEAVPSTCRQFQSTQHSDTAKDHRPVTELKRNIPLVFNKCSRPKLDIRNSAAILRAVNRSNHKRPCASLCSNECKGQPGLARTPKFQKPDRTCKILQSNFLCH